MLREVNEVSTYQGILCRSSVLLVKETGSLRIGTFTGNLQKGKVYSGGTNTYKYPLLLVNLMSTITGSSSIFCKLTGAHGKVCGIFVHAFHPRKQSFGIGNFVCWRSHIW